MVIEDVKALPGVVRRWVETLLHRRAAEPELVDGAPRSRWAVAAKDVVALLAEAGRPDAAALDADAERRWRATGGPLADLGLDDVEQRIVAALIAPEIDPDLERIFAYAWNDFTRKRPDVGFLIDLIGGADEGRRDAVRAALATEAPLRAGRIVLVGAPGDADTAPALRRTVRLADRVIGHLTGDDALDPALEAVCTLPPPPEGAAVLDAGAVAIARRALHLDTPQNPARVLVFGPAGAGKALLARVLAAEAGRPVLRVDAAELWRLPDREDRLARLAREAALRRALVVLRLGALDDAPRLAELSRRIGGPVVYTAHARPTWLVHAVPELVEVAVEAPGAVARAALWRQALGDATVDDGAVAEVVARFALTGAAIARAAERAVAQARVRDPAAPRITLDDLTESARLVLQHRLGTVARRITPGFAWSDLVLPDDTLESIRELVDFAKHRTHLLEAWGFGRKLPYGRGVSAILAGPPGTGKTMVAQLLARELGYELYLIELAQVVNKYIGETEKNLARVFDEAEGSHAILFFDEADALFARRTEVKSSTDRYANLEVNYLLQRMETYNGVTLLATNLEQGIDEAFKRRVRFSIRFEMPEADERERLWQSMFPPEVALADDIDWRRLARWEMSGGYIKKAALRAAARALHRGPDTRLTHADLEAAAQLEYREMGRVA